MPNPNTNFKLSDGRDLGSVGLTKEYLMTVYPQIANQLITPELWGWGYNSNRELGVDDANIRCTPVTTSAGGANWKSVASSSAHTAAIKTDGTLWNWGDNLNGGLGINVEGGTRPTPLTTFAGGTNWKQVACGGRFTAAIKTDGTLWSWGANSYGQLGTNDTTIRPTPVTTFAGGTNWKQVACGNQHTAAIKTDGTLWGWGRNSEGQMGRGFSNSSLAAPVTTFAGGTNWKQVACGQRHTAAIKTDGTLWTWGNGPNGQLGNNVSGNNRDSPVTTFAGGTNWKQVACGYYLTAAIKTDGTLWTWGNGSDGNLGNFTQNQVLTPITTFAGGTNWKQFAADGAWQNNFTAIKTDGTLWTWGNNRNGQLGINSAGIGNLRCTPVTTFAGGTNWKQSTGSMAIRTSDDLIGI